VHRMGKIILDGLEKWASKEGADKEWRVQLTLARLEAFATELAARVDAYYLPTRKDVLTFVLNNVSNFDKIVDKIRVLSPVPVVWKESTGETPLEALNSSTYTSPPDSPAMAIMIELRPLVQRKSYSSFVMYHDKLSTVLKLALGFGAIGSSVRDGMAILFADTSNGKELIAHIVEWLPEAKVGVGIARKPRTAMRNAVKALEGIGAQRRVNFVTES